MRLAGALLLLTGLVATPFQEATGQPTEKGFDVRFGARIPLKDGIHLGASLYLPERGGQAAPTLFFMTPYGTDHFHAEASALARRGFAVAAVDVRGRGNSEGEFEPWAHDGRDGFDVTEWLARQPWSTGKVGMFGHSYGGRAVWSTLKERPPHLAAAVPIAASLAMQGWNNILTPDVMQWILLTAGASANSRLAADSTFWVAKYRELYLGMKPLAEMDEIVGTPSPLFDRFLAHPTLDAYWSAVTPTPADFARLRVPVLTIVGQYEFGPQAALWYYHRHLEAAGAEADHQLLLGPWDHRGSLRPSSEAGGLDLGEASRIDMVGLLADWFAWRLLDAPRPSFLSQPVRYYELGTNRWLSAQSLDAVAEPTVTLDLDSDGEAGSLARPGALRPGRRGTATSDDWIFDPRDLRRGQAELEERSDWASHFAMPADLWGSGVVYLSEPLSPSARLAGEPQLRVWMAIDTPDADFAARLDVVGADGKVVLIGEDWVRARFHASVEREQSVPNGVALEYQFKFPFQVRQLAAGSRLRLVLSSPNSIFQAKNYNAGGEVARESGKDARIVQVRVVHDAEHPSRLELGLRRLSD